MLRLLKRVVIIGLLGLLINTANLYAQEPAADPTALPPVREPVMKSIFWNTVLGSGWGALMGAMGALSSPNVPFRDSLILGTTFGGMVGYGFGVYLVIRGITFDPAIIPSPSPVLGRGAYVPPPPSELNPILLLSSESRMKEEKKRYSWQTTVFQLSF